MGFILKKIERLRQKVAIVGRDDLGMALDRVHCVISGALAGNEVGYGGKNERAASLKQEILMAIER